MGSTIAFLSGMPSVQTQRIAVFVLLYSALTGLMVAFSPYYEGINADTAVAYMNGFVRWTPFFWTSDRYGMLVPALASSISNPLFNVIAQNAIHVFFSAACFFMLALFLFPGRRALEVGAVSLAGYIVLSGLPDVREFLTPWQIYTPALSLGLLALLVVPRIWWLALVFSVLAEWCNFSVNLLLTILVVARAAEQIGREDWRQLRGLWLRQGTLLFCSSLAGYLIKQPYTHAGGRYTLLPVWEALQGWVRLISDYTGSFGWTSPWLPLVPFVVGCGVLAYRFWRSYDLLEEYRPALRSLVMALFVALSYAMIVGGTGFAKMNGFPRRYLIPSLMIWMVAWVGLTVNLLPAFNPQRWLPRLAAAVLLLMLPMLQLGVPSIGGVRASLDRRFAVKYSQIPASCTHLTGNYYRVWDSVFYSYMKGDRPPLWGIAGYSEVTRDLWDLKRFKQPHVCYWRDDEKEALETLQEFGIANLVSSGGDSALVDMVPSGTSVSGN